MAKHRSASTHAMHIGRVGALAVTLGVGFALSTPLGIAYADEGTTNSSPQKPQRQHTKPKPGTAQPAQKDHSATGDDDAQPSVTRRNLLSTNTTEQPKPNVDDATAEADPGTTPKPQRRSRAKNEVRQYKKGASAPAAAPSQTVTPRSTAAAPATAQPTTLAVTSSAAKPVAASSSSAAATTTPVDPAVTTTTPAPNNPIARLLAIPGTFITNVMNALKPALFHGGDVPAHPPLVWALLAWTRRQFLNDAPQFTIKTLTPNANGTTTVDVNATDPDRDRLTYTATSGAHGTVTVDRSGDCDGSTFTYTPDAGYTGEDTFTITASDRHSGWHLIDLFTPDCGRSTTTTITIAATQSPQIEGDHYTVTAIHLDGTSTSKPIPGTPYGAYTGTDGTTAITTYTGTGTPEDPYKYTVTVVHPNNGGITSTSTPIATMYDTQQVGPNGTTAMTIQTGSGTTEDPHQYSLLVIHPDGSTTTSAPSTGNSYVTQVGANGTTALTTQTGSGTAEDPYRTTVTVIHPNGATTAGTPIAGAAYINIGEPGAVVQADGTTMLTTQGGANNDEFTVTVIHPNGTTTTTGPLTSTTASAGVGTDGTTAVVTQNGFGTPEDPSQTTITVVRATGSLTHTVVGYSAGDARVGADGTTVVGTNADSDGHATFVVIHPDDTVTSVPISGAIPYPQISTNGTVIITSRSGAGTVADPYRSTVTVISPDGTIATSIPIDGTLAPVGIGANGTTAQAAVTGSGTVADPYQFLTATIIAPDGTTTSVPGDRYFSQVGADGTAAVSVRAGSGTAADPYTFTVNVVHPNGTITAGPTTTSVWSGPVVIGTDGTTAYIAHTVSDTPTGPVTAIVVHPNGNITTYQSTGWVVGTNPKVGDDGTAYLGMTAADNSVSVAIISPTGQVTVTPVDAANSAIHAMSLAPGGTAYTTTVTSAVNTVQV